MTARVKLNAKKMRPLRQAVAAAGGTIDEATEWVGFINLDAPDGFRWAASGVHALCVSFVDANDDTSPALQTDAIDDALERVAYGLEPCDDPECDICHPDPE